MTYNEQESHLNVRSIEQHFLIEGSYSFMVIHVHIC